MGDQRYAWAPAGSSQESELGKSVQTSHLYASVGQSWETSLFCLLFFTGEGREPSFRRFSSAHRTPFNLATESLLIVGLLIDIVCTAKPHFPSLYSTCRNAFGDPAFPSGVGETRSGTDRLKPPLEPNHVTVDHHQQCYRFLMVLPNVIGQPLEALQDEASSAAWLSGFHVDATKLALKNRTEEPLLLDVFTEQKTSQLARHSMPLRVRRARKASKAKSCQARPVWRSLARRVARISRGSHRLGNP